MKKVIIITTTVLFALGIIFIGYQTAPNLSVPALDNKTFVGKDAHKDMFPVLIGEIERLPFLNMIKGESDDPDLKYRKFLVELPLVSYDYYYGKFINASSAVNEINQVQILRPGDRVQLINDGYLTMSSSRGYVNPGSGFYYASGVCWSTSDLGTLMDEANKAFQHKYDKPLFTFYDGDRVPHSKSYSTYKHSNYGRGYTVVRMPSGWNTDYKFNINPSLKDDPNFKDLKIEIVMVAREDNENAFWGQSIGAYLMSNIDF